MRTKKEKAKPEGWSRCDNCEWQGVPDIGLWEIPDLGQRIDEDGIVPSGECPECGALCYIFPSSWVLATPFNQIREEWNNDFTAEGMAKRETKRRKGG